MTADIFSCRTCKVGVAMNLTQDELAMGIVTDGNMSAASGLRRHAEAQLQAKADYPRTEDETQRLLHELQVHRIELEMQNAELRQARDELEKSLEKYTELYDFAPVGYFTLDRSGDITAANLSGAGLLGIERSRLIGRSFGLWVVEAFRPAFATFLDTVYTSLGKVGCEVALLTVGKELLYVQLEAMDDTSGRECRLALIDITERKKAETDLRCYARRLVEMEEALRKKIATELHDEIGRDLTVVGMNQAVISKSLPEGAPPDLVARVTDSSRLIEGISRTARGIMVMLRPPLLDDYGLLAALRWHADLFTKRTGIAVAVRADYPLPRLMIAQEMAIFRIAQEALMNTSKHAETLEATITISSDNGMFSFTTCDHGKGFAPQACRHIQDGHGWGMTIMRERAELVGGIFSLDSIPGKGTTISVAIPLEEV